MKQYLDLARKILTQGNPSNNRTGVWDKALFGEQYKVLLSVKEDGTINGFPLLTTKELNFKNIFSELMWKLSGSTNIRPLLQQKNNIWTEWPFKAWLKETGQKIDQFTDATQKTVTDEWKAAKKSYKKQVLEDDAFAEKYGNLGITYGHNFRKFGEHKTPNGTILVEGQDQLMEALWRIRNKPDDRRIIISLWDPRHEKETLLPPCPCFYQFNARVEGSLDLMLYQRSCDTFLGVPYNMAQDTLLLCMMAHVTGRKPHEFTHNFGDVHIYHNHFEVMEEQLTREPKPLPSIRFKRATDDILSIQFEDIELLNYDPYPRLKGEVAV